MQSNKKKKESYFIIRDGYLMEYNGKEKSIIIPKNVKYIGPLAFNKAYDLETVRFEEGSQLEAVKENAFIRCVNLSSICFPKSLKQLHISSFAGFQNCNRPSIYFEGKEDEIEILSEEKVNGWERPLFKRPEDDANENKKIFNEEKTVFYQVKADEIVIQDGVQYIIKKDKTATVTGYENYYNKKIIIQENIVVNDVKYVVNKIGKNAFKDYTNLFTIKLPNSIVEIKNGAFERCYNLKSVYISKNVKLIEKDAFPSWSILTIYCEEPSKPKDWESKWCGNSKVYWNVKKEDFVEQDGIVYFINNNEASVVEYTLDFQGTANILESIRGTNGLYKVTSIEENAFKYCESLTDVKISKNIKSIGKYAFADCENLPYVYIPNTVTTIKQYAFDGANTRKSIYCEEGTDSKNWYNYWNSNYKYTHVLDFEENIPTYWQINKDNFYIKDGIIFVIIDKKAIVTGRAKKLKDNIKIPSKIVLRNGKSCDVTSIAPYAFYGCAELHSISIPNGVTGIYDAAFGRCVNLDYIYIHKGIKTLAVDFLEECKGTTIYIGNSDKYYDDFDEFCDYENPVYYKVKRNDIVIKKGLQYLIKDNKAILTGATKNVSKNVIIPSIIKGKDGKEYCIEEIGSIAFTRKNGVSSIVIPSNIKKINERAIYDCNFTNIFCEQQNEPKEWGYAWYSNVERVYFKEKWVMNKNRPCLLVKNR